MAKNETLKRREALLKEARSWLYCLTDPIHHPQLSPSVQELIKRIDAEIGNQDS